MHKSCIKFSFITTIFVMFLCFVFSTVKAAETTQQSLSFNTNVELTTRMKSVSIDVSVKGCRCINSYSEQTYSEASSSSTITLYGIDGNSETHTLGSWKLTSPGAGSNSDSFVYSFKASDYTNYKYIKVSAEDSIAHLSYRSQSATGSVSHTATIELWRLPSISSNISTTKSYNYDDSLSFRITATGKEPLSYQWYMNDSEILGATSNTLDLGMQKDLSNNGASIYCIVSNDLGSATSQTCVLTANVGTFKPSISASSLTTNIGSKVFFVRLYKYA